MKDIRTELDAIANSAEGRRAFEYVYRLSLTCECERGGEPAQPAADDEDGVLQDQTAPVFSSFSEYLSQKLLHPLLHHRNRAESIHAYECAHFATAPMPRLYLRFCGHSNRSLDLPIGLSCRPRDGSVV